MASLTADRTDWAEDSEPQDLASSLPAPQISHNKDGTETIVTFFLNDEGQKVKRTQRIRRTVIKRYEKASVAERKTWAKFGVEAGRSAGPHPDTTTLGENIVFNLMQGYRAGGPAAAPSAEDSKKTDALKKMAIKCRICNADHFTARCPFKNDIDPTGELAGTADLGDGGADGADGMGGGAGAGGAGGSSYVPPHLRGGKGLVGERMGGKFERERDDLATLRVTNVSEMADEDELRDLFSRYGRVTRVFLAKDRDTGLAKGFCFVSFVERSDAARAQEKMDNFGYKFLILRVEFAKKATDGKS